MVSNECLNMVAGHLQEIKCLENAQSSACLTIHVIYNGLCFLAHTTNFLKDGCLASISPPYDKNTKMCTSISFPEHYYFCPTVIV